ncbi:MAG: E3 ubiquitin-protein transferase rmnd5a [Paramarteilia canceri]
MVAYELSEPLKLLDNLSQAILDDFMPKAEQTVDDLLYKIDNLLGEDCIDDKDYSEFFNEAKSSISSLVDTHRKKHINVSKYGKSIEKVTFLWIDTNYSSLPPEKDTFKSYLFGLHLYNVANGPKPDPNSLFLTLKELSKIDKVNPYDIKQLAGLMILDKNALREKLKDTQSYSLIKDQKYVAAMFRKLYLNFQGFSHGNPLEKCFSAGFLSLPIFINHLRNNEKNSLSLWKQDMSNISLEIDLPKSLCFHSRFICPVLKVQSDKNNCPQALICGHFLSKDAIANLLGKNSSYDFKCPYCPSYTRKSEIRNIYF